MHPEIQLALSRAHVADLHRAATRHRSLPTAGAARSAVRSGPLERVGRGLASARTAAVRIAGHPRPVTVARSTGPACCAA